jgi:hypothetical protein
MATISTSQGCLRRLFDSQIQERGAKNLDDEAP